MTRCISLMVKSIVSDTVGTINHQFLLNYETDPEIIRARIIAHINRLFPRALRCQIISIEEFEEIIY